MSTGNRIVNPQEGRSHKVKWKVLKKSDGNFVMNVESHLWRSCTYNFDANLAPTTCFTHPEGKLGLNKCLQVSAMLLTNPRALQHPIAFTPMQSFISPMPCQAFIPPMPIQPPMAMQYPPLS